MMENEGLFTDFRFMVNQKIRLRPAFGRAPAKYVTVVQEVLGDRILVGVPVERGDYVLFHRGDVFEASIFDSMGVYTFTTRIIGRINFTVPMYVLEKPSGVHRFQRRESVRTCAYLPVAYDDQAGPAYAVREGWTRDIGTGGICLATVRKPASALRMTIEIPEGRNAVRIRVKGDVRSFRADEFTGKILSGVMFRDLAPECARSIARYVAHSERLQ